MNSDITSEVGQDRPSKAAELGQRIGEVLRLYGSKSAASGVAGVSADQLTRYERGASMPPFDVVIRLADGAGVSLPWLANGEGAMMKGSEQEPPKPVSLTIDGEMLATCMRATDKALAEVGRPLNYDQRARMIASLYNDLLSATDDEIKRDADLERLRQHNKNVGAAPPRKRQEAS